SCSALRRGKGRRDRADEVARARGVTRGRPRQRRVTRPDRHPRVARGHARAARDRRLAHALRTTWAAARNRRRVRPSTLAAPDFRSRPGAPGDRRSAPGRAAPAPVLRRAPFGEALVALGARRPDVVVLSADLGKYTDVAPFAAAFPERFFQVGMAE